MDPVKSLSKPSLRFVVLVHRPGPGSERSHELHWDWMFECDGRLRTWATPPVKPGVESEPWEIDCESLADHRLHYLDHEGDVSGDRGTVQRKIKGTYTLLEADHDLLRAALEWVQEGRSRTATVAFYRSFRSENEGRLEESRASWRLRFSPGR